MLKKIFENIFFCLYSLYVLISIRKPKLLYNFMCDMRRVQKFSGAAGKSTKDTLKAKITINYHRLEKGLSLSEPRVGFGIWAINELVRDLKNYIKLYSQDETTRIAVNALDEYIKFNKVNNWEDSNISLNLLELLEAHQDVSHTFGGTQEISSQTIHHSSMIDLTAFFENRYSIRSFSDKPVDKELIKDAVIMAQKTPSVCNRQSSRVYMFSGSSEIRKVLGYQNGNRGFTEQVDKVLIVTSQLSHFVSVGERNQCWIDGGMFAMSLVYALHSLGLGTCCLNWSVERDRDLALKKSVGIPDADSIIMLVAVGNLPEKLRVAQSPRKRLEDVLIDKSGICASLTVS